MATDFANVSFARDGRLRLLIIVGTRPEVIRLSEVIKSAAATSTACSPTPGRTTTTH